MKKNVLLLCFYPLWVWAQNPCPSSDMTSYWNAKYSANQYLKGQAEAATEQNARRAASSELASTLQLRVSQQVREDFREDAVGSQLLSTSTGLFESDLVLPAHTFEVCRKRDDGYHVFVFIERARLIQYYRTKIQDINRELSSLTLGTVNPPSQAKYNTYLKALSLLKNAHFYRSILVALGVQSPNITFLRTFTQMELDTKRLSSLVPIKTVPDLARELMRQLAETSAIPPGASIRLKSFTALGLPENIWVNPFSDMLMTDLIIEAKKNVWNLKKDISDIENVSYEIQGSYRLTGDELIVELLATGQVLSRANLRVYLSKTEISKTLFEQPSILPDQHILAETRERNGLTIRVTTNKGVNSPVFYDRDSLKVLVKVNKPAWVHLIYRDADGNHFLLGGQTPQKITQAEINQWVRIEKQMVFGNPPYGNESLYAVATEDQFSLRCQTIPLGNNDKIMNLSNCLPSLRGAPNVVIADAHIPIITRKNRLR